MATVQSSTYEGRYMKATVTINSGTKLNWKIETLGGDNDFYSTGPTTLVIGSKTVYSSERMSYTQGTSGNVTGFPIGLGSVSGTVDMGSYGDFTISLTTAIYSSSTNTNTGTITIPCPVLTIKYHANGGVLDGTKNYTLSSSIITNTAGSNTFHTEEYVNSNSALGSDGFYNNTTFGLIRKGYRFIGWSISTTSGQTVYNASTNPNGTIFDHNTGNIPLTKINSSISSGSKTVIMYAIWEAYILTLNLHCNGADYVKVTGTDSGVTPCEYSGSSANNYIVTEKLKYDDYGNYGLSNGNNNTHIFMTRTGYHYKADATTGDGMWNTKADGSGISAHWGTRDYDTMGTLIKDLFNVDYSSSNKTLDLYIMWEAAKLTVTFNDTLNEQTTTQEFYYDSPLNQFGYNSDGTPKWEMTGQFGKWQFIGYKLLGWYDSTESESYEIYHTIDNDFILNKCSLENGEYKDGYMTLSTVLKATTLTINYHTNGADYVSFDETYDKDKTTFTEVYYDENASNQVFSQCFTYFHNEELNNGLANPNNIYFINMTRKGYTYSRNDNDEVQWNTKADGSGNYYRASQWKDSSEVLDTDNRGIWAKEFLGIDYSTEDAVLDLYMIWVKESPTNVMYVKHTDGNWYRGELYVKKLVDNEVIIERDINIITRTELGYRIGLIEGNTYTIQIIERDMGGTNTLNLEAYRDSSVGGFITLKHGDPNSYSGTNIEIIDGSSLGAGNSTISGDNCLYKFGEPIQTVIITGIFEKSRYAWFQAENININENNIWI